MNSPFPGMDPYLERYWRDLHQSLITYARDELQDRLPPPLRARIEERVYLEAGSELGASRYPDVYVAEYPRPRDVTSAADPNGGIAVAEPTIIKVHDDPITENYLEIREAGSGNRVITVIEFLSPTNKLAGPGRDLYQQKQRDCLAGNVNLVEIDLVRQGERAFSVRQANLPARFHSLYAACVRRACRKFEAEFYAIRLRDRLPAINIPLREGDSDVTLDLQQLFDRCQRHGRYADDVDYSLDPEPTLDAADAAWADQLLRSVGLRGTTQA